MYSARAPSVPDENAAVREDAASARKSANSNCTLPSLYPIDLCLHCDIFSPRSFLPFCATHSRARRPLLGLHCIPIAGFLHCRIVAATAIRLQRTKRKRPQPFPYYEGEISMKHTLRFSLLMLMAIVFATA